MTHTNCKKNRGQLSVIRSQFILKLCQPLKFIENIKIVICNYMILHKFIEKNKIKHDHYYNFYYFFPTSVLLINKSVKFFTLISIHHLNNELTFT